MLRLTDVHEFTDVHDPTPTLVRADGTATDHSGGDLFGRLLRVRRAPEADGPPPCCPGARP
ncbi:MULTISPECIES: hypothetical protein [unclassified Nocardiopsis]|uniref:hypothetical protein n=1 Tax=Nocardiopsis TaxID=2013 RepID=UPI00387B516F